MSRNLCSTSCGQCPWSFMVLEEKPRPITKEEAGPYFNEYDGMLVANAKCPMCEALYLAWVNESCMGVRYVRGYPIPPREADEDLGYFDLSYRAAFNDEPWVTDLPIWKVHRDATREPA